MRELLDAANYSFHPNAVPSLITAILMFLLGLGVLRQEKGTLVSRLFFLVILTATWWQLCFTGMYLAARAPLTLFWLKAGYLGIPFIAPAAYHFSMVLLGRYPHRRPIVQAAWLVAGLFALVIVSTDTLITGLHHYWWGPYPRYGWLAIPYLLFFCGLLAANLHEYWMVYRQTEPGTTRLRIRAFMIAFTIGYVGLLDYVAAFGIPLYPLGYVPVLIFLIWVVRTIRRYRLVAITPSYAADKIIATMADLLLVCDVEARIFVANRACCQILGYEERELIGQSIDLLVHNRPEESSRLRALIRDGTMADEEMHFRTRDGETVEVSISLSQLHDQNERQIGTVLIARDIRERKQAEQALQETQERLRIIVANAPVLLFSLDTEGRFLFLEGRGLETLGISSDQLLGQSIFTLYGEAPQFLAAIRRALAGESLSAVVQIGESVFESWYFPRYDRHGAISGISAIAMDITRRKRAEEQLRHDALHDALTGLPNRALFIDRLHHVIRRASRHPNSLFAVLFLDFDHFKVVNDSLGHMAGDRLLIGIARRLEDCLRPGDTVARLGGDEFVILLEDIESINEATSIARHLLDQMAQPFQVRDHEIFISASIGIAPSTTGYDQPEDLLRDADLAMYRAKALGRSQYALYDMTMHAQAMERLQMEMDLRQALEREELEVYYQPIVSCATNRTVGFEALLRWHHPLRGIISPAEFIPVAEESGIIVQLDRWVMRKACQQVREWQRQFPADPPLTISVNISGKQFSQCGLIEHTEQVLQQSGLDPTNLKLEITESVIMENAEVAATMLRRLRTLGVQVQMDDFGTGYSSLSYLHQFPIDTLKIDRSFISRMGNGGERAVIVHTIVTLARNLGMQVVAEGVETVEQAKQLKKLNCEYGQGFLFAPPLKREDIEALLVTDLPVSQDN